MPIARTSLAGTGEESLSLPRQAPSSIAGESSWIRVCMSGHWISLESHGWFGTCPRQFMKFARTCRSRAALFLPVTPSRRPLSECLKDSLYEGLHRDDRLEEEQGRENTADRQQHFHGPRPCRMCSHRVSARRAKGTAVKRFAKPLTLRMLLRKAMIRPHS